MSQTTSTKIVGNATNLIRYTRYTSLTAVINDAIDLTLDSGEPQCVSLEGETGAGKTTLLKDVMRECAIPLHQQLYVRIPDNPAPTGVLSKMLQAIGDPAYDKIRHLWEAKSRLIGFIQKKKLRLLGFDDLQHFYSERYMSIEEASEYLKDVIKETEAMCIVTGITGQVEPILDKNDQLSRLFAEREIIDAFKWEENNESAVTECFDIINLIENTIDLKLYEYGDYQPELVGRIIYATGGVMANMMNLIRLSRQLAKKQGASAIEMQHLATAFERRLEKHMSNRHNPFLSSVEEKFIHELKVVGDKGKTDNKPEEKSKGKKKTDEDNLNNLLSAT